MPLFVCRLRPWWQACLLLLLLSWAGGAARASLRVADGPQAQGLALLQADIVHANGEDELVGMVARDLGEDLARVGPWRGRVIAAEAGATASASKAALQIWVGTPAGHPALGAALVRLGLDARLRDCWECYLIARIDAPQPGMGPTLLVAGSDRRGVAYGVYELSQALGVSPWHWWAEVAVPARPHLSLAVRQAVFGRPSVRYRGLFINDEDWGLQPWAAHTLEPKRGNIGPRTYEKVFQLLLRLKANTLWPAMHKVSTPFNADPENASLAQRYGIVMGSSHAEPLLRNNVGEWTAPPEHFNYASHPEAVSAYWRERLQRNGGFENLYTLGMRGIHDSGIQGPVGPQEQRALLERILRDQRRLLREQVLPQQPGRSLEQLPQIFVPYKEVLALYRAGLDLPGDVTLVWPDDNFGYIRHFPNASEQRRPGGSGVYYHLSYLGAPLSYLWLSTTPPALVTAEMTRAYDLGADRLWMVNAGDIKPAELNLSHFFALAWDVAGQRQLSQRDFLKAQAAQWFGPARAGEIAALWEGYYRLNFERRPEHLQFHLPREPVRASGWPADRVARRLADFQALLQRLDALQQRLPAVQQPSFFQLVDYPLRASALANQRFFALEAGQLSSARAAHARLQALTARYNQGRWAGMLAEEPADGQWASFRLRAPQLDGTAAPAPHAIAPDTLVLPAWQARLPPVSAWQRWQGLAGMAQPRGRQPAGGDADLGSLQALQADARLSLALPAQLRGDWCATLHLLPLYPADGSAQWLVGLNLPGQGEQIARFERGPQDRAWAQGVLDNRLSQTLEQPLRLPAASVQLRALQAGLMLQGLSLSRLPPGAASCR